MRWGRGGYGYAVDGYGAYGPRWIRLRGTGYAGGARGLMPGGARGYAGGARGYAAVA